MPERKDEYKDFITDVFSRSSETYSQVGPEFFQHFGRRLVEFSGLSQGAQVLDVASGRGAVLFPAALAVSAAGHVTGIDLAEGMVQRLTEDLAERGVENAKVLRMDAENLDFPDASFDCVISGFSFFFYPDLGKALAEFWRVLKPGGVLATTTFEKFETNIDVELRELGKKFKNDLKPVPEVDSTSLDSFEEVQDVFGHAGFVEVESLIERRVFYYRDVAQWWQVQWSHGRRAFLERMNEEVRALYRDRVQDILQKHTSAEGIPDEISVILSRAKKPE